MAVPNSSYGLCRRKATMNERTNERIAPAASQRLHGQWLDKLMHGDYCGSPQSRVVSTRSEKLIIIRMYLWWSLCTYLFIYTRCTSGGVYVRTLYLHAMYLWWSLCTYLVFTRDVPLMEFMYVPCIYTRCTSGGVYVRTLYLHAMYL